MLCIVRNVCISLCFFKLFCLRHVLGCLELLKMINVDFTKVLYAFLSIGEGDDQFVADLKADAPGPWEGVGGG